MPKQFEKNNAPDSLDNVTAIYLATFIVEKIKRRYLREGLECSAVELARLFEINPKNDDGSQKTENDIIHDLISNQESCQCVDDVDIRQKILNTVLHNS